MHKCEVPELALKVVIVSFGFRDLEARLAVQIAFLSWREGKGAGTLDILRYLSPSPGRKA